MYKDTWDITTPKGKKRIQALTAILKKAEHRENVRELVLKCNDLRGLRYFAIYTHLQRNAASNPPTTIGKLWKNLPDKPNRVKELFSNKNERALFVKDLKTCTISELKKKYKKLTDFSTAEVRNLIDTLGIARGHISRNTGPKKSITSANWWKTGLPTKDTQEKLLERWRSDYRLPGNTKRDILDEFRKYGCPNETGLQEAARGLGEKRNRHDIVRAIMKGPDILKAIEGRVAELIRTGTLNRLGFLKFHGLINKEFANGLAKQSTKLDTDTFKKIVSKILWTEGKQGTLTALREAIKSDSVEEFISLYKQHIPRALIDEQAQEERGKTNRVHRLKFESGLLRGVGRFASPEELKSGEKFAFPQNSFRNPFPVLTGDSGSILVLNGANIGTKYNPILKENPVFLALVAGRIGGDASIILTNTIDLYTKKAGGASRVQQAIWSGMNVNPDLFPESYRKEVLNHLKDKPDDAVIYQKPREALHNAMSGWQKLSLQPNKKPEFPGKVYVVFGIREHQFAAGMAYWHVHYLTRIKQADIKLKLQLAYSLLYQVEKKRIAMPPDLENRIVALHDLDERTIISNVIEEYWQLYYQRAVGYLAKKFEETIPNCTVIGMSTTHVKLGPETMTLKVASDSSITDGTLSAYTSGYGPIVLRGQMPRFVTLCHPYGLRPASTAREVDRGGKRDHAIVFNAPACIDEQYLREKLKHVPGKETPIARKVWSDLSAPGVLRIRLVNDMLIPEDISIGALRAYAERRSA